MDRNEYKAKLDEIKKLLNQEKKEDALELLRSENWKKVPNVNILKPAGNLRKQKIYWNLVMSALQSDA